MTASSFGNLPKLTVIVPVRNAAGSVGRTIDSLLVQHYPKLELIVWDGNSSDGTKDVLARYAPAISRLISEADSGPADACNRALAYANGDYIGYLNAGDEYEPGILWAVAEAILHQPQAEVVSLGMLYRSEDRQGKSIVTGYYAGEDQLVLSLENTLSDLPSFFLSRFIRRELAQRIGPFTTDNSLWPTASEREWMTRLALTPCRNVIVPRPLYGFYGSSRNVSGSSQNSRQLITEHLLIAESLLKRDDLSEAQRKTITKWQNRQYAWGFWKMFMTLQWGAAREFARRGMHACGWHWIWLSLHLLLRKAALKAGLALSHGIDRGAVK